MDRRHKKKDFTSTDPVYAIRIKEGTLVDREEEREYRNCNCSSLLRLHVANVGRAEAALSITWMTVGGSSSSPPSSAVFTADCEIEFSPSIKDGFHTPPSLEITCLGGFGVV